MKNKKKVIELLKSGNFTIMGIDHNAYNIYKGKGKHDNDGILRDSSGKELKEIDSIELDFLDNGYVNGMTVLLSEALGGVTDSY